jgi:uncharacterized SAM-binding protein YcdF (DUF218 family)
MQSGSAGCSRTPVPGRWGWLAALATGAVLMVTLMPFGGIFLVKMDRLEVADAALVFSGDPGYERTLEAARLYRAGYVKYLVFSGRGGPGDSAKSMAAVAMQQSVPARAVLQEDKAISTYENVLFVRPLLAGHNIRRLILVTSPYHQRRAYLVARQVLPGIILINHPASTSYWGPRGWWRDAASRRVVFNEYVKIAGYLFLGRI